MSEPATDDTVIVWIAKTLAWIASGAIAGMTAAAAWFNAAKERLHRRMTQMEDRMDTYTKAQSIHDTQLAVIHSNQDHLSNRMNELRDGVRETNSKLDELLRRKE